MRWGRGRGYAAGVATCCVLIAGAAHAQQMLDEIVVTTPSSRPEPVTSVAGTVQVINREKIERSTARSVTDLLAENAVGFMSEWTPGQTSINIRGAATEGQGRDFRSQVLVLLNGHRAGTANISKLSIADIDRIEIVRGPSSVVYGSQNMGGVINIILKTGLTAPGTLVEGSGGSWGLVQGKAQTGGSHSWVDWYAGIALAGRDDFHIGGGRREGNTAWNRKGATAALGAQVNENNRLEFNVRTDGVYDAGFRGSSANLFAFDTRTNQSFDANYYGKTPDERFHWFWQVYGVNDVDDLNNPSPLSALNAVPSRTTVDHNKRNLDIIGTRVQPRAKLWAGNELLVGFDFEESRIRSDRFRAGGAAVTQVSPQDNNQHERVYAYYAEDVQKFFDDRFTIRGGVRKTEGATSLDATPYAPTLIPNTKKYDATTYSTGGTVRFTDWLSGRIGASTGFRAPTATELGANFTITPIGTTIFGNPNLSPESSRQVEAGGTVAWNGLRLDAAVFQNVIQNRIGTVVRSSVGGVVIQDTRNNPADIVVQGVEIQSEGDILAWLPSRPPTWRWSVFGNGYYHFKMTDYGAVAAAGTDKATRINQYGLSVGTRFGQAGTGEPWRDWSLQVLGILRGPMWYNTEESLSPIYAPGQVRNTTVYRKEAFWVWNVRGEVDVVKGVKFFAAVNNIFDINQHPIFIALDQIPCIAIQANQNGSCGNSMPGREFIAGLRATW
jgi:vitamin B12 transporter